MADQINQPTKTQIDPDRVLTSESGEDVITDDIKKAKGILDKLTYAMKKKAAPVAGPTHEVLQKVQSSGDSIFSEKTYKKVLRVAIVFMIGIVFVFLSLRVFFFLRPGESTISDVSVTPTTFTHALLGKTVYADDPDIIRIKRDLTVLKNEMERTPLRDTTLTPPSLNMDVSF